MIMRAVARTCRFVLRFIASVVLGCAVAGVMSILHQAWFEQEQFDVRAALMIGFSLPIFAALPAAVFGLPAMLLLRWRRWARVPAATLLMIGGATIGWALMNAVTITFSTWAALTGGSVGLMLGLLTYSNRKLEVAHA